MHARGMRPDTRHVPCCWPVVAIARDAMHGGVLGTRHADRGADERSVRAAPSLKRQARLPASYRPTQPPRLLQRRLLAGADRQQACVGSHIGVGRAWTRHELCLGLMVAL